MANITDFLQQVVSGNTQPRVGVWVRLTSNTNNSSSYISTTATDSNGLFTINGIPADSYTVATGITNTGPWINTGDVNYTVAEQYVFNVLAYGAKGDGNANDTTAISAAINAANAATNGGQVYFPAGTYKVNTVLPTLTSHKVSLVGAGSTATTINFIGVGDCVRIQHSADTVASPSGVIRGINIDGTTAGSAAVGIHIGDVNGWAFEDVSVQNFAGATAVGIWFDNQVFWCERVTFYRVLVANNTKNLRYTINGGNNSFDYHRYIDLRMNVNSGQIGFSIESGALFNCIINLLCNVNGSSGNTAVVFNLAGGTVDGSGNLYAEQTTGTGASFLTTAASPNPAFKFAGATAYGTLGITLGAAGTFVERNAFQQLINQSGAVTVDAGLLPTQAFVEILITGNVTSTTLNHLRKGQLITLGYQQVAPGNFSIVPPTAKYAGGASPTFSTTSTWQDFITFHYDGVNLWEVSRSIGDH